MWTKKRCTYSCADSTTTAYKMGLLQGMSFAAGPFTVGYLLKLASKDSTFLFSSMTKAALRVLTAVCCLLGVSCRSGRFFLGIMGFQPSFFLLHPPLLQVEAQCQEEQLHPDILLPGGQKSAESKVILQQIKCALQLDRTIRPQQDAPLAGDVLLGCFSLLPEGFFPNDLLNCRVRRISPGLLHFAAGPVCRYSTVSRISQLRSRLRSALRAASSRIFVTYSLGLMPYSALKAR